MEPLFVSAYSNNWIIALEKKELKNHFKNCYSTIIVRRLCLPYGSGLLSTIDIRLHFNTLLTRLYTFSLMHMLYLR